MSVQPSAFVENLMTQLPAVRDHVVVLEQHALESARIAGRTSRTKKRAFFFGAFFSFFSFFRLV